MPVWFVASGNAGTSSFLETGTVAVNFYVRASVEGQTADEIKSAAARRYTPWDEAVPGTRTRFAGQLEQFASELEVGDQVITFDGARRALVLVGRVVGGYRYEDPAAVPEHPHVRDVEWIGVMARGEMPDAGAAIPSTPGITVRRLYDFPIEPTAGIDDAPPVLPRATEPRPRSSGGTRTDDHFAWEPLEGGHRYLLRQTFGATTRWSDRCSSSC